MKKPHFNQFIYSLFFFFIFTLFFSSLTGCKEKPGKNEYNTSEYISEVYNYFYESTYTKLLGKNTEKFYLPQNLEILLTRPVCVQGLFYTVFELCYPPNFDNYNIKAYGIEDYSDIYDSNSDNGNWVERVLFSVEEERIGAELTKMEEIVNSGIYAPNEEVAAKEAEEKAQENKKVPDVIEITGKDNRLRFMEFGEEVFIPMKIGDSWIFINAFGDKVTRSFYDNLFRCFTEEKWEINKNGTEELKKTVKTDFYNDSYKPSGKTFITDSNEKKQFFNEKGFLIKEEVYNIIKEDKSDDNPDEERKLPESVLTLKYNSNNKVIESNIIEYTYDSEKKDKVEYEFNKKYVYKYNSGDIPPDFDYYEEGKLKIRNKYESAGTYTSEVFFEDGFHVKTFYKDGKLIKEVFVTNDSNERTKNYE